MVVGAFPAAKLGVLLLKQISKPIANALKVKAKDSVFFREWVCMPPAQFYNWCEVKAKMWSMNLGKPIHVPQLNETMAIELGANLLGESIIFVIGAGVLIFEYVRSSKKEALKDETNIVEKKRLELELNDLAFRLEMQDTQIREMQRITAELESRLWLPKRPRIVDEAVKTTGTIINAATLAENKNMYSGRYPIRETDTYPPTGVIFRALNDFLNNRTNDYEDNTSSEKSIKSSTSLDKTATHHYKIRN